MTTVETILAEAVKTGASDIHLHADLPPAFRVHGNLESSALPRLSVEQTSGIARQLLGENRWSIFETDRDFDFSFVAADGRRYRINAHYQRATVALAIRVIADKTPTLESLLLPAVLEQLTNLPRGLVLVTGGTGSGKSTTLAAMIRQINDRDASHIVTLEDPIEFVFRDNRCRIEQREVGSDVPDFAGGLRHVLRQDPDVIMVGEMRDRQTTAAALEAAETGHLVLSTLHTAGAAASVDRIIDMADPARQNQTRSMLAATLSAVVSQTLVPRRDRPGLIAAVEVMLCTPAVRNCIRENRTFEIPAILETGRAAGMQTLDASLKQWATNGYISRDAALAHAAHPDRLRTQLAA